MIQLINKGHSMSLICEGKEYKGIDKMNPEEIVMLMSSLTNIPVERKVDFSLELTFKVKSDDEQTIFTAKQDKDDFDSFVVSWMEDGELQTANYTRTAIDESIANGSWIIL